MEREQLIGQYARIRMELASAYRARRSNGPHIDRLAEDLARIERALTRADAPDEQSHDPFLGFTD